jgi:hypothetical protein
MAKGRCPHARTAFISAILIAGTTAAAAQQPALVKSRDGKSVGYKDTPILPWSQYHKHDPDRPLPTEVAPPTPGTQDRAGSAPSDAIVLLASQGGLSQWKPNSWTYESGILTATEGDIETVQAFGDCQLHVEWQTPDPPQGEQMNRGNSGVFLLGRYEVQIFDSYTEKIYADGSAASVYGETPPMVNATLPPGRWQTYDILFTAPRFKDGKLERPATVTVLHNSVLVQWNTEIRGPVMWRTIAPYEAHSDRQPLKLQAHGNPVRFRNIWIRPIDLEAAARR